MLAWKNPLRLSTTEKTMSIASTAGGLVCTISGMKIPLSPHWTKPLGLQYLDRKTAMEACEAHFADLLKALSECEDLSNKAELAACHLIWSDMQAYPSIPFSLIW